MYPLAWTSQIPASQGLVGPTERCLEWPLAVGVMALGCPGRVLDAGCALNMPFPDAAATVIHVTQSLSLERQFPDVSYAEGDLRALAYPDGHFDRTVCVSTLEHIGADNRQYGGTHEQDYGSADLAVAELCRVTSGDVFLSVPYWPEGYDLRRWRFVDDATLDRWQAIAAAHGRVMDQRFYALGPQGWYGGGRSPVRPARETPGKPVNSIVCAVLQKEPVSCPSVNRSPQLAVATRLASRMAGLGLSVPCRSRSRPSA